MVAVSIAIVVGVEYNVGPKPGVTLVSYQWAETEGALVGGYLVEGLLEPHPMIKTILGHTNIMTMSLSVAHQHSVSSF